MLRCLIFLSAGGRPSVDDQNIEKPPSSQEYVLLNVTSLALNFVVATSLEVNGPICHLHKCELETWNL